MYTNNKCNLEERFAFRLHVLPDDAVDGTIPTEIDTADEKGGFFILIPIFLFFL